MKDRLFAQQSAQDWLQTSGSRLAAGNRSLQGALMLSALIVVLGLLVLAFGEPFQVRLAFAAFVNVIVVIGLQIFMGNANIANLGHAGFMGIGAYAIAILATPVAMKRIMIPDAPFGLAEIEFGIASAALIAVAVTAVAAVITGVLVARLNGIAATILTLALLVIIHSLFFHWDDLFRGNQAFFGIPRVASLELAIVAAAGAIVIGRLFKDSRLGVQLRASAQNELAARAMGVNVWRLRLISWVLGSTLCGIGGILFALYMGTINPRSFYFHAVFMTLAMLIMGGMRTVTGAVVGVLVLTVGMEVIRNIEGGPLILGLQFPEMLGLSGLALGVIIVTFMILRPDGIMGDAELDDVVRLRFNAGRWFKPRSLTDDSDAQPETNV